jgi:hypothetical protein
MKRFTALLVCVLVAGCSAPAHWPHARVASPGSRWIRTELFFGLSEPDGSLIDAADWNAFLDEHILPRFPEGLTVLDATGRYLDKQQRTIKEPSKVVIFFYAPDRSVAANSNLTAIAAEYCSQFKQESVLRTDSLERASFLSGKHP